MTNVRVVASVLLTAAAIVGTVLACAAAPVPVSGGANQIKVVSGTAGEPMWNGVVRYKVQELRDARPEDHPEALLPGPNQKVMVFRASLRNGTSKQFAELLTYTLADKNDVAFEIPGHDLAPSSLVVAQGDNARIGGLFLADKSFVPVKLLIQCATCATSIRFVAFRVTIPAQPAPAPSP
jgi:hypothetical protein